MAVAVAMPDRAAKYRIRVRNKDLQFIGEVPHWIRLQVQLYFNEVSKWVLELDLNSEGAKHFLNIAADPNNGGKGGVYIERNGYFLLSGPMTEITETVSVDEGEKLIVSGSCDLQWIADHLALPHPKYMTSPYMTTDGTANGGHTDYFPNLSDTTTNAKASTHIHNFVWDNIGEGQEQVSRRLSFLTTRDNLVGYTIPNKERSAGRGENLFELCKGIADYSDYKGYPIRMVAYQYQSGTNPDGSPAYKIRFECLASQAKPNAIMSPDLGTITAYTYTRQRPEANQILMGGSGQGKSRRFAYSGDTASKNLHGVIESFEEYTGHINDSQNSRWNEEKETLAREIGAILAEKAEKTIFSFQFQETPTVQYGRDFQIGDIVPVRLKRQSTTDVVRAVSFDVDGDQERIEVVVGKQSAISKGLRLFDRVKNLEYRYNGLTKRTLGE